jgi:hypothetical protein
MAALWLLMAQVAPAMSVADFQTLDFPKSADATYVYGIEGGKVVGAYTDAAGAVHGFLMEGGNFTTLDDAQGIANGVPNTAAYGVSGHDIAGDYLFDNKDNPDITSAGAYRYRDGKFETLNDPDAGPLGTSATGIDGGNVVGWYVDELGLEHGFFYDGANYTTVDAPDGVGTYAQGVAGGNIVGFYYDKNDAGHGFVYNGTTFTTLDDPDAGPLGTSALGVSGKDVVGSYVDANGMIHGFVYDGSTYFTIDEPHGVGGTEVHGISGNRIAGFYYDEQDNPHGFTAAINDERLPPTIEVEPSDAAVNGGDMAILSVVASGSLPLHYQWYKDGTAVPEATSASLVMSNVTASDGGQYQVDITNDVGRAKSNTATLTITATTPPQLDISNFTTLDEPNGMGATYAFGIEDGTVVGTYSGPDGDPNTHGFYYDGKIYSTLDNPNGVSNGVKHTYVYGISGGNMVGDYVQDADGDPENPVPNGFWYHDGKYLAIAEPDADADGASAAGVDGGNIVGWYVDGDGYVEGYVFNGTGYTSLNEPDGTGTYAQGIEGNNIVGYYYDQLGEGHGFLYNGTDYTTLNDPKAGPQGTSALGISGANIVGSYADEKGLMHGFFYDGSTYFTIDAPLGAGGTEVHGISGNMICGYYYDARGYAHGFTATVGVMAEPPSVSLDAISESAAEGGMVISSVTAQGSEPLLYQWYNEGKAIAGATGPILTLFPATAAIAGTYYAVVSNLAGSATSSRIKVTPVPLGAPKISVIGAATQEAATAVNMPVILTQPQAQTAVEGQDASFSVDAGGSEPLNYQWQFDGTDIPEATEAVLTLHGVSLDNAGSYDVVVTNAAGSNMSNAVRLTVNEAAIRR